MNKRILPLAIFFILFVVSSVFAYFSIKGAVLNRGNDSNIKSLEESYKIPQGEDADFSLPPTFQTTSEQEAFRESIQRKAKNHIVKYTDGKLSPETVYISQGDVVTWQNFSDEDIEVLGDNAWKSFLPVGYEHPNNKFSQQFDIVGNYKYIISSSNSVQGVVRVQ